MATLSELTAWRDALKQARYSGTRTVQYDGKRVEYGTDEELRQALADIEREIAVAGGQKPVTQIRISTSKGL